MNIQHIHGVPPLYTNTFLIITNAKHGILIDAAAEPGAGGCLPFASCHADLLLITQYFAYSRSGRWRTTSAQRGHSPSALGVRGGF